MPREVIRRRYINHTNPYPTISAMRNAIRLGRRVGRAVNDAYQRYQNTRSSGSAQPRRDSTVSVNFSGLGKRRKRTILSGKGHKKVRVSKQLRQKIQKVVEESDEVPGKYTKYTHGYMPMETNNVQGVNNDLRSDNSSIVGSVFEFFTPLKILDAASILFNGKTPNADPNSSIGNLDDNKAVIHVDYMAVKFKVKNFSLAKVKLKVYECVAKKNLASTDYAWKTWADGLSVDNGTVNLSSVTVNTMGVTPQDASQFSSYWKTKVHRISLKPGQGKTIKIIGPKGKFNFPDYFVNSTFKNIQRSVTTNLIFVVDRPLLLWDDANVIKVGAAGMQKDNGNILGVQMVEKFVIRAPELCEDAQKFKKFAYFQNVQEGTSLVNTCYPSFIRRQINVDQVG